MAQPGEQTRLLIEAVRLIGLAVVRITFTATARPSTRSRAA